MDIYAEITKKQLREFEEGKRSFSLPDGVELIRKQNSRACYFSCDDDIGDQVKDMLDDIDILWQES